MLATEKDTQDSCFHADRWPLHKALAWVLSRNIAYFERATPDYFADVSLRGGGREGEGWGLLHADMTRKMPDGPTYERVQVLVYGTPDDGDCQETIPVATLETLDWGYSERDGAVYLRPRQVPSSAGRAYRDVYVPARALLHNYPIGSTPLLCAMTMLGPAIDLREVGFLPLSQAAQWIAMKGNTFDFFLNDAAVWKEACDDLIMRITRSKVRLIGRRGLASEPEVIDGHKLFGLPIDYPYIRTPGHLITGHVPYINFRGPHSTQKDWMLGADTDELWTTRQGRPDYTHLAVCAQDVEREWPAPKQPTEVDSAPPKIIEVTKAPRGRKAIYDWASFEVEANRILQEHGGISSKRDGLYQEKLVKQMQEWCMETWGEEPSISQAREHVSAVIDAWNSR